MFSLVWTEEAEGKFAELRSTAQESVKRVAQGKQKKSSKQAGLFKQVQKSVSLHSSNPKHPSLHTHEYDSIENPYDKNQKVFEAYAQNKTPGAYRIFWCFGPGKKEITIIAITPHP